MNTQIEEELNTLSINNEDQDEFLEFIYQYQNLINDYDKNIGTIKKYLHSLKLDSLLNNSLQLYCKHNDLVFY